MTIQTISITGDAILFAAKNLHILMPSDAECAFVRVDQNTREVFIDYLTSNNGELPAQREGEWGWVVREVRKRDILDGLQKLKRDIVASARQPNTRPPGVADNWWYGKS